MDRGCTALVREQIDDDEHEGRNAQQPRYNILTHDGLQIGFAGQQTARGDDTELSVPAVGGDVGAPAVSA